MMASIRLAALTCLLATAAAAAAKPPNIVLMMADDLGIGDIGCFGNDTLRTPNIDRLAAEGVRLDHDLAAAALCTPSRAAWQTGRYPVRSGMVAHHFLRVHIFQSNSGGLPPEEITIGEVAKSKGYTTGFVGKWHLGMNCHSHDDFCHHPNNQGYDYFYGLPVSNGKDFGHDDLTLLSSRFPNIYRDLFVVMVVTVVFLVALYRLGVLGLRGSLLLFLVLGFPPGFLYFILWAGPRLSGMVMRDYQVVEQPVILEGFTDRLIQEGAGFLAARAQDGAPFLLVVSWIQVHTALHSTRPFRGRSAHGPYGDEVEEMDWSVGEILRALDSLGLADNTLVYFTSDHGGHLEEVGVHGDVQGGWNGKYKGGKAQGGMEGGIRVPTVVRWPGVLPRDAVVTVPTSQMDVLPTVAAAIGAPVPADRAVDGVDILPVLKAGPAAVPPHDFLVHYCGDVIHAARYTPGNGSDVYKAFFVTHKFLSPGSHQCEFVCRCRGSGVNRHDPPLLYNVGRDPTEEVLLDPSLPENQRVLAEIRRRVDLHRASLDPQVESQFAWRHMLPRPALQVCCNFPSCKCTEKDSRIP